MNEETLKACYDKSLQLMRAKEAREFFSDILKTKTITEIASHKYLNVPRSYIYQMLKGERPIGKKVKERMQIMLDTIK